MEQKNLYSRRQLIKTSLALGGLTVLMPWFEPVSAKNKVYKIAACDWSIGKKNDVGLVEMAKKIGLDGLQLDLGNPENKMGLWHPAMQQAYKEATKKHHITISSLALGTLNQISYKSEPQTEEWVSNSIDVARAMGCKVILLAFFAKGDIKGDAAGQKEVIAWLKRVAPKAEKAGVILGIESLLSADEHLHIIEAVGSENIRVYYDVANSHKMGYNIYEEIKTLGSKYICEIHAKEIGALLGQGNIDFVKVKNILDDIDYKGWVIIENAIPKGADVLESYITNNKYLRSVLNR